MYLFPVKSNNGLQTIHDLNRRDPFDMLNVRTDAPKQQLKKDAAWKPLIRLFRRYLKKEALTKATYLSILSMPLAV